MAFAPALLTASESVNYTPRYQRPRPPVFFQTSRSWRLLLSRYALEAYATALERRATASPRPTKPETIETMKVWEPC